MKRKLLQFSKMTKGELISSVRFMFVALCMAMLAYGFVLGMVLAIR
jgi:hypothetical protein